MLKIVSANAGGIREKIIAGLLYLLFLGLAYPSVIFWNKSIEPALFPPYGMTPDGPYGYTGRKPLRLFNADIITPAFMESPTNQMVGLYYKKGILPLWNPHLAAGAPLAAEYSTSVFFPYQILKNISPYWLKDYWFLGRIWLAGFLSFLFLRLLKVGAPAGFLGGLLYMFSGTFGAFLHLEQMGNGAMMLPAVLIALELLARPDKYALGSKKSLCLAAAMIALLLVAGQPEIALYVLLLGFCYYLLRAPFNRASYPRFFLALALGLGLAGPLIFPFLEYLTQAYHGHGLGEKIGSHNIASILHLLAVLMPGMLHFVRPWSTLPFNGEWDYIGGYSGIVAGMLALAGVARNLLFTNSPTHKKLFYFFFLFAVGMLFKNINLAPFSWLGHLPLFDITFSGRWAGPCWTFSVAAAGALAADHLASTPEPWPLPAWKKLTLFALTAAMLGGLAITGSLDLARLMQEKGSDMALFDATEKSRMLFRCLANEAAGWILGLCAAIFIFSKQKINLRLIILLAFIELTGFLPKGHGFSFQSWNLIGFLFGILGVLVMALGKKILGAGLALGAFIFWLALDAFSPFGFPQKYNPYAPAPYVEYLKKQPGFFRCFGYYNIMPPTMANAAGLYDLRHGNALMLETFTTMRRSFLFRSWPFLQGATAALWFTGNADAYHQASFLTNYHFFKEINMQLAYYSFLGVKYILLPAGKDSGYLPAACRRLVYKGEISIFENKNVLPRAFIVRRVLQAAEGDAWRFLKNPGFDFRTTALIEGKIPAGHAGNDNASASDVRLSIYEPNKVVIQAKTQTPGLLVLTDSFYPGWKAWINGEPAVIEKVNGLARGVFLRPGEHEVIFRYRPMSFYLGLAAACGALIIMTALCLSARRKSINPHAGVSVN